jgi:hypothetical protein
VAGARGAGRTGGDVAQRERQTAAQLETGFVAYADDPAAEGLSLAVQQLAAWADGARRSPPRP